MNYSKWLLVTLSALAVAACGGDGDDNGSGGGNGGGNGGGGEQVQNTEHQYYTLAYASTDLTSARTTTIPHFADSGQISLGGANVAFSHVNDDLVVTGYRYMMLGEDFTPDEGGMVLCQDNAADSPIWHAILPAKATEVTGSADDKLAKLIEGRRFDFFEECGTTNEVFVVAADGGLSLEIGGTPVPDEEATAEQVKAMLSDNGWTRDEDGEEATSWVKVYEFEDSVFAIIIDRWVPAGGGAAEYEIMILAQEEARPV